MIHQAVEFPPPKLAVKRTGSSNLGQAACVIGQFVDACRFTTIEHCVV